MSLQKQRGIYIKSQEWKRDEFLEYLDEQIELFRVSIEVSKGDVRMYKICFLDSLILTKNKFEEIYK